MRVLHQPVGIDKHEVLELLEKYQVTIGIFQEAVKTDINFIIPQSLTILLRKP